MTSRKQQAARDAISRIDTRDWLSKDDALRRLAASDVEIRQGLLALNGAALVATIGLFGEKLSDLTIWQAAWGYFAGLVLGIGCYVVSEIGTAVSFEFHRAKEEAGVHLASANADAWLASKDGASAMNHIDNARFARPVLLGLLVASLLGSTICFIGSSVWVLVSIDPSRRAEQEQLTQLSPNQQEKIQNQDAK